MNAPDLWPSPESDVSLKDFEDVIPIFSSYVSTLLDTVLRTSWKKKKLNPMRKKGRIQSYEHGVASNIVIHSFCTACLSFITQARSGTLRNSE